MFAHWLWLYFGVKGTGPWYGFWSGAGSDVGELLIPFSILSATAMVYRKHNCEVDRCWRLARHITAANHAVCRKHHPDDKLTHQDVLDAHEEAQSGRAD